MPNPASHPRPVAEISIHGADGLGYSWSLVIDGRCLAADGLPVRTPTEAIWLAVDAIREDRPDANPHRGTVAIYSPCAHRVAYAPLWAVPQYNLLPWEDPWAPAETQDLELVEHLS